MSNFHNLAGPEQLGELLLLLLLLATAGKSFSKHPSSPKHLLL
jgi:hypothetical protein